MASQETPERQDRPVTTPPTAHAQVELALAELPHSRTATVVVPRPLPEELRLPHLVALPPLLEDPRPPQLVELPHLTDTPLLHPQPPHPADLQPLLEGPRLLPRTVTVLHHQLPHPVELPHRALPHPTDTVPHPQLPHPMDTALPHLVALQDPLTEDLAPLTRPPTRAPHHPTPPLKPLLPHRPLPRPQHQRPHRLLLPVVELVPSLLAMAAECALERRRGRW